MAEAISKITKTCLAKAFPQAPSVCFHLHVSKLGFTSASNYSQQQGSNGDSSIDPDEELGALTQKSKENLEEMLESIEVKGQEKSKDDGNETAGSMANKTTYAAGTEEDKAEKMAEGMKAKAEDNDYEKGEPSIGDKARPTVEEMWVGAKDTKDEIKESVVGKSKNDVPDKKVCEDVVDSARKVGNFDHEK